MLVRWAIKVRGVVQGVGFRPFVFSLATKHRLLGRVWNDQEGVHIDVEGQRAPLEQFLADLTAHRPALSQVDQVERVAHLEYVPMPGGEKAIREPWRMAAVYLQHAYGADWLKLGIPFVAQVDQARWTTLKSMTVSGTNSPDTSSMGRLFDAVASLVGLRDTVNYEGQAAVELESICDIPSTQKYNFDVIDDGSIISAQQLIREAVADLVDGVSPAKVSAKFHASVAELIATMARLTRSEHQLNRVVLSGGVFQNMILLDSTRRLLADDGFDVSFIIGCRRTTVASHWDRLPLPTPESLREQSENG